MAYNNNREWDKGKDAWNQSAAWSEPRANVRPREDDYHGEGKRRKFNTGGFQGYDATQSYDQSGYDGSYAQQPGDYSQDYTSQDERPQQSRGPGVSAAGGGPFPKKRLQPSEPSPHVIFLGLDPDFTEADLQAYLTANACSIETVTIIRERSTGTSKGFGFAQFPTVEHARAFVDPLFPFIQVPPPASHGASATAAFYKALETGLPHNGRRVKIDYSQSATPHDKGRINRGNLNDGTRDIGNSQAAVLLFRGLDPLSGPQAIHQAMIGSSGPGKPGAKGMKRIILIKDRVTLASFGFAFVEFVDAQSASAVLAATMSPQIHPSGFRISDRPVAASFAHPYSFQPVDFMARDDACVASSPALGGVDNAWVRYWDESSTIAVLEFQVEQPAQATVGPSKEKEKKKKKVDLDANVIRPVFAVPSALPVSDKPVTLSFGKGFTKTGPGSGPVKPITLGFSMDDDETDEAAEAAEAEKKVAAKKVAPMIASKKTANNINKWNQVQEELSNDASPAVAPSALATPSKATVSSTPAAPEGKSETTSLPAEADFEFSDLGASSCLLCARQFKSVDQLKRHNKESDLHKKNYKDANMRDVARQKLAARSGVKTTASSADQPKYRDRASERRVLFNQPEAPVIEKDSGGGKPGQKRQSEGPPPAPSPPPPPVNPGQDESNVGNKMLKMMGWTEGTGLGTSGEGRVDPIQTAIYAQGVGLGASKGKDIGTLTEGNSYLSNAQASARERYKS